MQKQCTLNHYAQLCIDYGRTPSEAQIEQITSAVGDVATCAAKRFLYELLFFVSRSTVILKNGYLLVGWVYQPDGTKQEIWFRHVGTRGHVYYHDLIAGLSVYLCKIDAPLCDEWHHSLDAICKPWQVAGQGNRMMLYALFNAIIKIMDTSPPPPCIEDQIPTNGTASSNQGETQDKTKNATSRAVRKTRRQTKRAFEDEDYDPTVPTSTRPLREDRTKKARPSVTVDLTDSDSEAGNKSEASAAPIAASRDEDTPITSAKQELLGLLQSKEVNEIEDMLAKQSEQLPKWIEKLAKEEMEKKMARDLAVVKSLF